MRRVLREERRLQPSWFLARTIQSSAKVIGAVCLVLLYLGYASTLKAEENVAGSALSFAEGAVSGVVSSIKDIRAAAVDGALNILLGANNKDVDLLQTAKEVFTRLPPNSKQSTLKAIQKGLLAPKLMKNEYLWNNMYHVWQKNQEIDGQFTPFQVTSMGAEPLPSMPGEQELFNTARVSVLSQAYRFCSSGQTLCQFENSGGVLLGGVSVKQALRCSADPCCPYSLHTNAESSACGNQVFDYSRSYTATPMDACIGQGEEANVACLLRLFQGQSPQCSGVGSRGQSSQAQDTSTNLFMHDYALLTYANVLMGSCARDYWPMQGGMRSYQDTQGLLAMSSDPCTLPAIIPYQGCTFHYKSLANKDTASWNGMWGLVGTNGVLLSLKDMLGSPSSQSISGTTVQKSKKQGSGGSISIGPSVKSVIGPAHTNAIGCVIESLHKVFNEVQACSDENSCLPFRSAEGILALQSSSSVKDALLSLSRSSPFCGYLYKDQSSDGKDVKDIVESALANAKPGSDLGGKLVSLLSSLLNKANTEVQDALDMPIRGEMRANICQSGLRTLAPADSGTLRFLLSPKDNKITKDIPDSSIFGDKPLSLGNQNLESMSSTENYTQKNNFAQSLLHLSGSYFFPYWELSLKEPEAFTLEGKKCPNGTQISPVTIEKEKQMIFVKNGRIMRYIDTRGARVAGATATQPQVAPSCLGEGLLDSYYVGRSSIAFKQRGMLQTALERQEILRPIVKSQVDKMIMKWTSAALIKSVSYDLLMHPMRRSSSLCEQTLGSGKSPECTVDLDRIKRAAVQDVLQSLPNRTDGGLLQNYLQHAVLRLALWQFDLYEQYSQNERDIFFWLIQLSANLAKATEGMASNVQTIRLSSIDLYQGTSEWS